MAADGNLPLLPPEPERTLSVRTLSIAALVILLLAGAAAIATMKRSPADAGAIRKQDPEAASLPITDVTLSEATNGAGGKSTYVDGTISNTSGSGKTLAGAVVQVSFAVADGSAPHRETLPLTVVRTRIPYVDLQPISAAPIAPGEHRDFRLIFETVPENWDVKAPSIQVIHAEWK